MQVHEKVGSRESLRFSTVLDCLVCLRPGFNHRAGGILLDASNQPVTSIAGPIPQWALDSLGIVAGEPGLMTIYKLLALLIV